MNKTVNINIGGLFFHIDEDAYQKLNQYFEAIKRSLSNSSGQDEIMKDIEMRVAELLTERQQTDKHVIHFNDIEFIIAIMGQPEDYRIDDGTAETAVPIYTNKRKKLYRDQDGGTIAGVCTGLGHYFGIDAVWIKLVFLFFTFFGGSGVLAYLIFWIATPKAVTTSEKLEMTGEAVTISNIERKVREEFESVSSKIKNVNYDELGNKVRSGAESAGNKLGDIIVRILGVFAKALGAVIMVFSSLILAGLVIGLLTFGTTSFIDAPWQRYIDAVNYTDVPLWLLGVLGFFAIGIPFFFFLLLGLKLLITNLKSIGNTAKYSLVAIWIISVGALIFIGIQQSTESAFDGKTVQKEVLQLKPTDTLEIKFVNNDFFSKNIHADENFVFTQDSTKQEVIYSNNVKIELKITDKPFAYLQIEKSAKGKSFTEANQRAEKIQYGFKITGNQIALDNYLLTEMASKYRDQKIDLYLYLPHGTIFKMDSSVQYYDKPYDDLFNINYSDDYVYKIDANYVKCLNCPPEENNLNDMDDSIADSVKTVSVRINGKEIIRTETKKTGKLSVDQNGVIIKTH